MKKIKILNITKKYDKGVFGGVEKVIDSICGEFNNINFQSDVFTIKSKDLSLKKKKYKIHYSHKNFEFFSTPFSFAAIYEFWKHSKNYNLFIFHYPWPFMDLLSIFLFKKRYIIFYHADIIQKNFLYYLYKPLNKIFFMRAERIICSSENISRSSDTLKNFKQKVVIIPYGIQTKKIVKNLGKITSFKDKEYFIFVGNLRNYKGIFFLVDFFKYYKFFDFIIIGDGKEKAKLIKNIKNIKNIKYLGNLDEKSKLYLIKNSMGLLLPSVDRREAFGISLLEASSLKKPMISTFIGTGTSFVNKHNVTGFNIKPYDKNNLKRYLDLLANNKILRKRMGQNSFIRYNRYFKESIMLKKYKKLFLSLPVN